MWEEQKAPLVEWLSLSFHCPWLPVVAVLVVVGSIPRGDFFCVANLLFLAAQRRAARDFGGGEKAIAGGPLIGCCWIPQCQKPRSWREKSSVLRVQFGHSEALLGAFGQIRAAARDVN